MTQMYDVKCPVCGEINLDYRGHDSGDGEWETMEFYYCPQCDEQFTITYHAGAIYEKMQESVWNMMKRKREERKKAEDAYE